MRTVRVLVTAVGGGGHGEQVLTALRLAEAPYHVVGTDMSPGAVGFLDADEAYVVPPADDPAYLPTLLELCLETRVEVLITGVEKELKVISSHRDAFERIGVWLPFNPPAVIDVCMDKWRTFCFLKENDVPVPRTFRVEREEDVDDVDVLPAIIKPSIGGGGSNNVFVAQDGEELRALCRYLLRQGLTPLVQEYVGTPDSEFTVGVLTALDGKLIDSIAIKRDLRGSLSVRSRVRNRTGRRELSDVLTVSSGISQGTVADFKEVREDCERIAARLGARGPLNIQCRFVDGRVYPFEINPRFSGTTSLRAMVGFNEPDLLIRHHLLGEALPPRVEYRFGRLARGLSGRFIEPDRWPRRTSPRAAGSL